MTWRDKYLNSVVCGDFILIEKSTAAITAPLLPEMV